MSFAENIALKLIEEKIKGINLQQVLASLTSALKAELDALRTSDSNHDGVSDLTDTLKDLALIEEAGARIFHRLEGVKK